MPDMRHVHGLESGVDIARLTVFREVAQRGSFTSAAAALRYTQSAVSRQIAALEQDVAAALFERESRGVRLTEEGRCLLAHAEAVLDRLSAARRDLAALREGGRGALRVGAFATAEAILVPRAIAAFGLAFPKVELTLVDGLSPTHVARLRAGELDLAVLSEPTVSTGRNSDVPRLRLHHLLDEPLLIALPATHRLAARRAVQLTELADEHWIAGSTTFEDTLVSACLRSGFRPAVRYVVQEWTAKLGLVAAGLGVTLVPGLAAGALRPDVVVRRVRAEEPMTRAVYAATADRRELPATTQRFLEFLTTGVAELRTELAALTGQQR